MTQGKRFKRLVRARARKTGESYTTALRHFRARRRESDHMPEIEWKKIARPDYGFVVSVPDDWEELTPMGGLEVLRLADGGGERRCAVLSWPAIPGRDARSLAVQQLPALEADSSRTNFDIVDLTVAGLSAVRQSWDYTNDEEQYSECNVLVIAEWGGYTLALRSPIGDTGLRDEITARFELVEPPPPIVRGLIADVDQREMLAPVSAPPRDAVVQCEVAQVELYEHVGRQVGRVLLRDTTGTRELCMYTGEPESYAIAAGYRGQEFARPMSHDLAIAALEAAGGGLDSAVIGPLREGTYFAQLGVRAASGELTWVDSRPSDALALALRRPGTTIWVDDDLLVGL
jgi:bifunctional DNase/RNase